MKPSTYSAIRIVAASLCLSFFCCVTTCSFSQTLSNINMLQRQRLSFDIPATDLLLPMGPSVEGFESAKINDFKKNELDNWNQVLDAIRHNKKQFVKSLTGYAQAGNLVKLSLTVTDDDIRNISYAVLATQKQTTIDQYLSRVSDSTDAVFNTTIRNSLETVQKEMKELSEPTVTIFASGNIRNVATNDAPEPTTSGTGTLGATFASDFNIFSVQFTVASTQDSLNNGFGAFVLTPTNGKALQSGLFEWYTSIKKSRKDWLHVYLSLASSVWKIDTTAGQLLAKNATNAGIGALYHYKFYGGMVGDTEVGLDGEIGLATRIINGDVLNLLDDADTKQQYLNVFPTEKKSFWGLEGGLSLNVGQINASLQAYYLLPKKHEPVDGLSKLQLSVGLSVRGDLFKGVLKKTGSSE